MALAAAKDLPQLNLVDELTILVARKDSRRHPRVAARWLLRLLEEQPDVTIDEAALAMSSLIALRRPPRRFGPWLKERQAGGGPAA